MPLRSLLETEKPARPNLLEKPSDDPFGAEPWAAKRAVAEPAPDGKAAAADPRFAKRPGVAAEPVQAFLRRRTGFAADAASPAQPPKGLTMAQRIEAAKARYIPPGAAPAPSPDAPPPPRHLTMTDRIALAKARFSTGLPNSVDNQHAGFAVPEPGPSQVPGDNVVSASILHPLFSSGSSTPRWGPTSDIPPIRADGMRIIVPLESAQSEIDFLVPNHALNPAAPPYLRNREIEPDTGNIVITVPDGYFFRPARNGRGIRLVPPNQIGEDDDEIRIMMPVIELYPDGYIVYYNSEGQRISPFSGRAADASQAHYHFDWHLFQEQILNQLLGRP